MRTSENVRQETSQDKIDLEEKKAHVLVIDDEPAALNLVKAILSRANYQVSTAPNCGHGLKLLETNHYDCIVTDAIFPMMSGYDFTKAVRKNPLYGKTPILMLTKKRDREDVRRALEAGVTEYLLKPIDELLLLDKVSICLKRALIHKNIYEHSMNESQSKARMQFDIQLTTISETGISLLTGFEVNETISAQFDFPIFKEIGIHRPILKFRSCEHLKGSANPAYKVTYTFVGLEETELMKIRAWMSRVQTRRAV